MEEAESTEFSLRDVRYHEAIAVIRKEICCEWPFEMSLGQVIAA